MQKNVLKLFILLVYLFLIKFLCGYLLLSIEIAKHIVYSLLYIQASEDLTIERSEIWNNVVIFYKDAVKIEFAEKVRQLYTKLFFEKNLEIEACYKSVCFQFYIVPVDYCVKLKNFLIEQSSVLIQGLAQTESERAFQVKYKVFSLSSFNFNLMFYIFLLLVIYNLFRKIKIFFFVIWKNECKRVLNMFLLLFEENIFDEEGKYLAQSCIKTLSNFVENKSTIDIIRVEDWEPVSNSFTAWSFYCLRKDCDWKLSYFNSRLYYGIKDFSGRWSKSTEVLLKLEKKSLFFQKWLVKKRAISEKKNNSNNNKWK